MAWGTGSPGVTSPSQASGPVGVARRPGQRVGFARTWRMPLVVSLMHPLRGKGELAVSRAVWFAGRSPGGRGLGGCEAELKQHLRTARKCELAADEVAGYGVFQRLGVQGGEYLLAGGVQQQP